MPSLKKQFTVAAVATASVSAGYAAAGATMQSPENSCNPNSGYIVSMQDKRTDRVMAVYYIKKLQALSMDSKGHVDTDKGNTIDAASMQLNIYLRGTTKKEEKSVYWVQDTVTFVYSKKGPEQYLSSDVYKFNPAGSEELAMSNAKGKGSIFSSGSCSSSSYSPVSEGMTYLYETKNLSVSIPQYGYLEMSEHLVNGRIIVDVRYWNGSLKKVDTYDTIVLGKQGEFTKAHFVSNSVLDAEMGFGGDGCGSTAYFMKMKAYVGMYFFGREAYTNIRYMHGDPSTAEASANLECRRTGGMEEFYRNRAVDQEMLKRVARAYDKKVLLGIGTKRQH